MLNKNFAFLLLGLLVVSTVIVTAFLDVNSRHDIVKVDVPRSGASGTRTASSAAGTPQSPVPSGQPPTLANPASVNCTNKGGTLVIQKRSDGGEYGLCTFEDAYACEEWALFRGECPVGGVRTTGYDTVAQKYCAWVGGQTLAEPNAVCTFADGSTCKTPDLFSGYCRKGDNPAQQ